MKNKGAGNIDGTDLCASLVLLFYAFKRERNESKLENNNQNV